MDFWQRLAPTLAAVAALSPAATNEGTPSPAELQDGVGTAFSGAISCDQDKTAPICTAPSHSSAIAKLLWDRNAALAEARARVKWHEDAVTGDLSEALQACTVVGVLKGARQVLNAETPDEEQIEMAQERRMLEYVTLNDFSTAVGFLLASTPEQSVRYYRDALCTLALAAGSTAAGHSALLGALPAATSDAGGVTRSPCVVARA